MVITDCQHNGLTPTTQGLRCWLTPAEAARVAGVSAPTLYRWLDAGASYGRKIGGRWRVDGAAMSSSLGLPDAPPSMGGEDARRNTTTQD